MGPEFPQPAPYRQIAARVAERLASNRSSDDPLAPWREEVVVSSGGVSDAIASELLARMPGGIAGLRLQSLETLAQRIANEAGDYPRVALDEERRHAMRTALRSVDDPMMETRGAAAMLERSYRDVRDSGLSLSDFIERVNRTPSLRARDRIRTVTRAWVEYERLIKRLGAIDPADLLARATALLRSGAQVRPQIVAGFYDVTGAQQALLAALPVVERWSPADGGRAIVPARPPMLFLERRTREEEARAVCQEVARLLVSGVPARAVGIVARSIEPYDVHLFQRFAREEGFAIAAAESKPLSAHRIGRALVTLLTLRDRDFPRADVVELLRSGLRLQTRIDPDKADGETRRRWIAGGTSAALRDRVSSSLVLGDYVSAVAELEAMTAQVDERWLARTAALFRIEDASDLTALDAIDRIAGVFQRATAWNRPFEVPALIDMLRQAVIEGPRATGVWLGDVMSFRGRAFEHLFAIRMQDSLVPQRRIEDPLLTDSDRRALGLREIGNGRDEEALLFDLLLAGGDAIHFSHASSDGFGTPLRASQYLRGLRKAGGGNSAPTPPTRTPTTPTPAPTATPPLRPLQLFARAGWRSPFDGYVTSPRIRERAAVVLQSVSPTHLEEFGECPQKFFFKQILGVRDLEDPERDVQINHREKGKVDHRILERYYRERDPAEPLDARLDERLAQIVDEEFDRFEETAPAWNRAMRAIERRATKRILRDFLTVDIGDLTANGLLPSQFEYRFGSKHRDHVPDHPEAFVVDADGVQLRVEGTIDRIDEGDGRFRIVDYKGGKATRHTQLGDKIDRGVRLQLALYAMAVADFFALEPSQVAGVIRPVALASIEEKKFSFELGDKKEGLRSTLTTFVRAITTGIYPAFPDEEDFKSCTYCPVNHSCRTRHDARERREALRSGEPLALLRELL